MSSTLDSEACLNCGAALAGPYCARCGQKQPNTDLTVREFVRDATAELTNWEGKIPATLKALFLKPGLLTLDYLAGRRARWLPPLRLYIICSLAYFVSKPLVERITHQSAREMARISITDSGGSTRLTPEGRRELEQGLPARIFGVERLERAAANSGKLNQEIESALPKATFVLLPIFALLTRVAWRRKRWRYPAHLYLALHLHAAWFGVLTVATVLTAFVPLAGAGIIAVAATAYVLWYSLATVRRVFGDSWARTIAKAASVAIAYVLSLGIVSFSMLAYALMRM